MREERKRPAGMSLEEFLRYAADIAEKVDSTEEPQESREELVEAAQRLVCLNAELEELRRILERRLQNALERN